MTQFGGAGGSFGPNAWLVDDMYDRFLADPDSVSESWREFFADYRPAPVPAPQPHGSGARAAAGRTRRAATRPPRQAGAIEPARRHGDRRDRPRRCPRRPTEATPLRGAASRIVANMEASLGVPDGHQRPDGAGPAARGQPAHPQQPAGPDHRRQGQLHPPHRLRRGPGAARRPGHERRLRGRRRRQGHARRHPPQHVGLGLAVDQEKSDGSRTLLVPCIKDADTLDFRSFVLAYEDLIRKIHTNKIAPDDFAGTTVTLTNPGTLGTVQSVPRLMPGQGAIIGVGRARLPGRVRGGRPAGARRARAGQGGDAHLDLRPPDHPGGRVGPVPGPGGRAPHRGRRLLRRGLRVDGRALRAGPLAGRHQRRRARDEGEHQRLVKQVHVQTLINMYRVRGHLIAHLDPLDAEPPHIHPELDPLHLRAHHLGPAPPLRRRRPGRARRGHARRDPPRPARRLLPDARASSTCTSRTPSRSAGSSSTSRA